eukprot:Clim_evm17s134 gene=Clim_evmTU17s134
MSASSSRTQSPRVSGASFSSKSRTQSPRIPGKAVKVAVIGSGVTGLAAAHRLAKEGKRKFDVTLYEADDRLGGHAYSKKITHPENDQELDVDLGFMVFNQYTYPDMLEWFDELGVDLEPSDMSFSVSRPNNGLEWGSDGINALFAQKSNLLNPSYYLMFADMMRFKRDAQDFLASINGASDNAAELRRMTLGDFVKQHIYGSYFVNNYLIPVCAAIWSASMGDSMNFPAFNILDFMNNHAMLNLIDRPTWLTVTGRSQQYVAKCEADLRRRGVTILKNCGVKKIKGPGTFSPAGLQVQDLRGKTLTYDRIILACHAPDSLAMAKDVLSEEQANVLSQFRYTQNKVYLHCDATYMPRDRQCWSSWNFMGTEEESKPFVTYWLNRLQNLDISREDYKPVLVTLNPPAEPEDVLDLWVTGHPTPTVDSARAQIEARELQGINGIFFGGAYSRFGFHQDGYLAGREMAERLIDAKQAWNPLPLIPKFDISYLDQPFQMLVQQYMAQFVQKGSLRVRELGGSMKVYGDGTEPKASIVVTDPAFYRKIALRYDLGLADAFVDGDFYIPPGAGDLTDVFDVLIVNRDEQMVANGGKLQTMLTNVIGGTMSRIEHYRRSNVEEQTRKNIADHYDLSNDMFGLFLDETMTYSCGIYRKRSDSLYQAQLNKLDHLIDKARIPTDRPVEVLEVGMGWGSLSIRLAQRYPNAVVTGLTQSSEQKEYADALILKLGLSERVSYELVDYRVFGRKTQRQFDRILSCEMMEAVGHEFLPDFFGNMDRLLKRDGVMVVQVISVPEERYANYLQTVDFIQEYIFPGSCCPSLAAVIAAMEKGSNFSAEHVENIGPHYAKTLRQWWNRFNANADKLQSLGFGEKFLRAWEYYFLYCEAGFKTRTISDYQIVFSRPGNVENLGIVEYPRNVL